MTRDGRLEIWSWPFGEQPARIINLSQIGFWLAAHGNNIAVDVGPEIAVVDHATNHRVLTLADYSLARFHWRFDGSLAIVSQGKPECVRVYTSEGNLRLRIDTPGIDRYANAFSPVRDDALLGYYNGMVLIHDFAREAAEVSALVASFPQRSKRQLHSVDRRFRMSKPLEQRTVEASSPEELRAALRDHARPAWIPVLRSERGAQTGSKFGGVPWIARGEEWPRCGQCGALMDLFMQLHSDDLPSGCGELFSGLLQVFVCSDETSDTGLCESHEPFSPAALLRIVHPDGPAAFQEAPDAELFDEQRIVGWLEQSDLPNFYYELEYLGVTLTDDQVSMMMEGNDYTTIVGDKLLGWPDWEQNVEYVTCPLCSQRMEVIFQLESCHGIPVMLADGGRAWVSQCPRHREVLSFHWQCG